MKSRITIIGGMGPQASLDLHRRLLDRAILLGSQSGGEFPEIRHLSLPIDDFISDETKTSAALGLISGSLERLDFGDQDKLVIACNTAHLLVPTLETRHNVHFTSLIDCTLKDIVESQVRSLGIMASPTTIRTRLYEDELRANEIKVILPSRKEIEAIEVCIRKVISGHDAVKLQNHLRPVIKSMLERGAKKVLLGCTELSVIFGNTNHTALVDPLSIIARELLSDSKLQK